MDTSIGPRIRKIRTAAGLTVSEVAKRAGFTPSYISQIERGVTNPSIGGLSSIAEALGVRRGVFFSDDEPDSIVDDPPRNGFIGLVRNNKRKTLIYPDSNIRNELLCPDLQHMMEIVCVKAPAGATSGDIRVHHRGEECFIVQKGIVEFTLEGETQVLESGDAIYFEAGTQHCWTNIGDDDLEVIWVRTPPNF